MNSEELKEIETSLKEAGYVRFEANPEYRQKHNYHWVKAFGGYNIFINVFDMRETHSPYQILSPQKDFCIQTEIRFYRRRGPMGRLTFLVKWDNIDLSEIEIQSAKFADYAYENLSAL